MFKIELSRRWFNVSYGQKSKKKKNCFGFNVQGNRPNDISILAIKSSNQNKILTSTVGSKKFRGLQNSQFETLKESGNYSISSVRFLGYEGGDWENTGELK